MTKGKQNVMYTSDNYILINWVTVTHFFFLRRHVYSCVNHQEKSPGIMFRNSLLSKAKACLLQASFNLIYKEWWLLSWASNYELRIAGWSVTQWPPMSLANGCAKCSKVETDLQRWFSAVLPRRRRPRKMERMSNWNDNSPYQSLGYLTQITHSSPNIMCDELISYLFVYV